jgi:hypothetical protein
MSEMEPLRFREDAALFSEAERAELGGYARQAPARAVQQRMLAQLEQTIARTRGGVESAPAGRGTWVVWGSGALGCATLLGTLSWLAAPSAESPARPEPERRTPLAAAPEPAAVPVLPAAPQADATPAAPVKPAERAPRATSAAPPAPLEELKLLTRARRVLPARPEAALALAQEHARLYARGAFAEEREVLAIEALVKLGRASEAERRAHLFLRRFPASSQRPRLETWVGQSARP